MRRFFGILVIVISLFFSKKISAQTYVKINLAGLPIGMINGGAEAKIAKHFTLQPEFFISPWESFFGNKLQIYNFNLEGRYYFKESFEWRSSIDHGCFINRIFNILKSCQIKDHVITSPAPYQGQYDDHPRAEAVGQESVSGLYDSHFD